jgi:hypothetical protein
VAFYLRGQRVVFVRVKEKNFGGFKNVLVDIMG